MSRVGESSQSWMGLWAWKEVSCSTAAKEIAPDDAPLDDGEAAAAAAGSCWAGYTVVAQESISLRPPRSAGAGVGAGTLLVSSLGEATMVGCVGWVRANRQKT